MECPQIDLYEFLTESELQHYYNAVKNELKVSNAAQFKYATDEDLKSVGMSRPEIRRLRKFYERHFPHGYLSKIKRLLHSPATIVKRDDGSNTSLATIGYAETSPTASNGASNSPSKAPNNKHIIPADSISVNKQLGTGEFGIVQQGVWTNGNERIQVAIKCLCRERMQSNPMEFLKEAAIMHSIEHENIVRLYGVVLATDSLMLVTELAHLRSLLECLKDSGLRISFLTIPTLCQFAMQICNGMKYLENKRLIHRDLAARNILVFSKNKVKISDFGLSRALGVGKDYYKTNFNVNLKLPIAWCAPECINYLRFTNASDVWAYGVCIWEMFSYGFQPWAALTGLQILEAIDAPNYQRLEQPDCCPREYYTLMMKCWQDDPLKRPKFSEIYELLPDMKPEQLKAVNNCLEAKKDHLLYRQGDIITVLDRNTGTPFWKGVLNSGKTGFFNPSNTVAYLEGLPSSNRDSFCRASERSSKRKLRTEMISKPQNDFKHTGHVGIDGVSFGDVAFLSNSQNYNHVPRQIVTPYKPSEDIEQTPLLLPPTPTSPDSLQTASGYFPEGAGTSMNPSFVSSNENTPKHILTTAGQSSFEFPGQHSFKTKRSSSSASASKNPFANKEMLSCSSLYGEDVLSNRHKRNTSIESSWRNESGNNATEYPHEYHEISDDEMTADKLDFGPSLLDEINSMFGSMSASINNGKSSDFEKSEAAGDSLMQQKCRKNSGGAGSGMGDSNGNKFGLSSHGSTASKKKQTAGTVKPISVKDEKILNQAIEIANEFSARSMNDLVSDQPQSAQSPKRKFSFRFPHLSSNGSYDKSSPSSHSVAGNNNGTAAATSPSASKKKNFTDELQSIPDLQALIGDEGREAYNSLIERKTITGAAAVGLSPVAPLLRHLDTNEFELATSKTLPRRSMTLRHDVELIEDAASLRNNHEQPLSVPLQNAPRPMTLPNRSSASRMRKAELLINSPNANQHADSLTDKENDDHNSNADSVATNGGKNSSPCESPSYLTNTFYKFPKTTKTLAGSHTMQMETDDINPIPLPSREGKKHIKTNPKRHVRKYPLIIPANGVQRTLNKVTEMGLDQNDNASSNGNMHKTTFELVSSIKAQNNRAANNNGQLINVMQQQKPEPTYQNLDNNESNNMDSASLHFESILESDSHKEGVLQSPDVTDGFYNFSIQKDHYKKGKLLVDYDAPEIKGLYVNEDELRNLDIVEQPEGVLKVASSLNLHEDRLKTTNSSIDLPTASSMSQNEANKSALTTSIAAAGCASSQHINNCHSSVSPSKLLSSSSALTPQRDISKRIPSFLKNDSELAGNALFKRIRESVDAAAAVTLTASTATHAPTSASSSASSKTKQTEAEYFAASISRLADSNSVSCEDLLEFSDKKPRGCERGVDSDEVRIMMKVLGKNSTPERCLEALEFIEWDVHKAIKIIKLQNILLQQISLTDAVESLQNHEWDLHLTSLKLSAATT